MQKMVGDDGPAVPFQANDLRQTETLKNVEEKQCSLNSSVSRIESAERVGRIRKGRKDGGFTVVRNELINHPTLAIEARALMIYLLSRPEDWELRIGDVRRFLGKGGKPCGRDKAYGVVRELKQADYLVMCEDIAGKHFAGVTYYVFDEPVSDPAEVLRRHRSGENALSVVAQSPLPENPEAAQSPLPCFPDAENQEETKERYIQNTNPPYPQKLRKTTRRNGSGRRAGVEGGDRSMFAEPWSPEWVEHRTGLLRKGREKDPAKPTLFLAAMIAKGGEVGDRQRLAHQARTSWPTVNAMDAAAAEARGWRVPIEILEGDCASRYVSVTVGSAEFLEWQAAHQKRGWPILPVPLRAPCVWLPADGCAALDAHNDDRDAELTASLGSR